MRPRCKHSWELAGWYFYVQPSLEECEIFFECEKCYIIKVMLVHNLHYSYYPSRNLIPTYWTSMGYSQWFPDV